MLAIGHAYAKAAAVPGVGSDATLKSIVLSTATTLVYSTGPSDFNYTTSVSPGTLSLTVQPTANDPQATVTVNGVTVPYNSKSGSITLNGIVTTTINMVVTAQDGVTTHTYSIVVYETGSNDAFLSAYTISTGNTLVPSSSGPGTFNYTTSVSPSVNSVTVTPTTDDANATVTYNGTVVTSGTASPSIALNASGTTTISVVVTAQDGVTTQTYSIIVSKNGSNNAILSLIMLSTNTALTSASGSSNFNYTTSVKSTVTSIKIRPTAADPTATITVFGTVSGNVTVASGNLSPTINLLTSGSTTLPTTINLTVTAQDGVTQQTYSITVIPNATAGADLSSSPLSANCSLVLTSSSGNTVNYTTSVNPNISSVTVTPTVNSATSKGATVTVNGVAVVSGTASDPITLNAIGTPTTITIQVTSQDGLTVKNTIITVNRNGSNNHNLGTLTLSSNTSLVLTSSTSTATYYQTSVPSSVTSITVTPTAADAVDIPTTITVNGTTVTSGTASNAITLNAVGTSTLVTIVVTAQDGSTGTTYITVLNTGSNNANLSNTVLTTTPATTTLATVLTSATTNATSYYTSVSPTISIVNIALTTADAAATLTYNGNVVTSGSAVPITLAAVGTNTVAVFTVKSPDGTVTKTWTFTIARNGSNNANVGSITLSAGPPPTPTSSTLTTANYSAVVSPHTISVTATTVTTDSYATITVNGLATLSGSPSYPIILNNGTTNIVIMVTAQDGVTTKTYTVTVTRTGTLYTWTGTAGTAYNNTGNWYPQKVPTGSDVVSFGEVAYTSGNQPSITGTNATYLAGEVYFGSATPTTLTIGTNDKLSISTALTVNANTSASIQSTSIGSAVTIVPGGIVSVGTGGQLTIGSKVAFTLQSNSAGSASVGQIAANAIVGNVSVERYITGGSAVYRGYRLLSSPVYQSTANGNNIYSLNYVNGVSLVTGITGLSGGFNSTGNPSLYLFREDQGLNNNSFTGGNYWGISNLNNAPNYLLNGQTGAINYYNIPVGNGFMFYFRGNTSNPTSKYTPGTLAESVTMTATGTLNAGQITVHDWFTPLVSTLSYSNILVNGGSAGLSLVGNPYASSIDWDTYNNSTPGSGIYAPTTVVNGNSVPSVANFIYELDPVSKNYGVYTANSPGGGTNNATHIIASGQAFFVQAYYKNISSLTFNEDAKTTTQVTGPNLLMGTPKQDVISQYLRVKLLKDTTTADEIYVNFKDNALPKFVFGEDAAQKLGYGVASLASMSSDGIPLSINALALPRESGTIHLNVGANTDGKYQLTVPQIKNIPALYDVWLMDAYKKDSVNIRQNPAYSFNIDKSDTTSFGASRFSLVVRQNPALGLHLVNFNATKAAVGAQVVWTTLNEENYTHFTVERSTDGGVTFNVLGGFLSSALGNYTFSDKDPLMTTNRYRLKLEDFNGNISYSNTVTLLYGNSASNIGGNISVYPNPASSTINLSVTPFSSSAQGLKYGLLQNTSSLKNPDGVSYDIRIFNITGAVVRSATSSSAAWQDNVSNLAPGTYIIQVINNSDKSEVGKSTFVKL